MPNSFDKGNYVLHYENSQLYLRLGLKLKIIHRVLEFNQSQWLKPYVEFNTEKEWKQKRNGDKDKKVLFNLMNNVVYGKAIEILRNRIDVNFVSNEKDYLKWTSNSGYMSQKIFDNGFVAIRKSNVTLTLNKPAYVSMCILDLIKVLMYKFHYDYIKNKYGNNSRLLLTDTDSLMFEIKTEGVYEDFSKNKEMFDFINYSAESKYDDWNKLVVGKMKDGTCGVAIK